MPDKAPSERQPGPAGPGDAEQAAALRLLGDAATYGGKVEVERIDTHGAIVFLAGARAYKVKRAVAYPYMDFSTLEKRRSACLREREINHRNAPELYLDVVPVTQSGGQLHLGGAGEAVEWVLVMQRFDQDCLLSVLAEAGKLTPAIMTALADAIARFHTTAEARSLRNIKINLQAARALY
ncbi:MAG: hypothetical protein GEU89_09715, partial [Kiloniellaceae bacterium]|nr:hypothetical protein [Kiloniellaceae bacterium]